MNEILGLLDRAVYAKDGVLLGLVNFLGGVEMYQTEYSYLTTEELVYYALTRDNRTSLELELAQRLDIAIDMLVDEDEDGYDAGSQSQASM